MFAYADNLLPVDLFNQLNERMLKRYKPNITQDEKPNEVFALRIRTNISENNDYTESGYVLGNMVPECVTYIRKYLEEKLHFKNPVAYSIWFQYMSKTQMVGKHFDYDTIRGRTSKQCYSTFLYSHKQWEDDWGGELCFNDGEVLPKSNRLILYSRDEEHWVNNIKHNLDNYQRMFLAVSWSTDNDF